MDISPIASPGHVRLIDCQALKDQGFIRIIEFPDFPNVSYSTVSYPWRGVSVDSTSTQHTFSIRGAEFADPICLDTIRHACAASLHQGCPYLWLDRLCIIQDDRDDKNWHIRQMHKVYSSCRVCIVLPGGIQRLVGLDEETPWIHRSWTLQEALSPPQVIVLLAWRLGSGTALSRGKSRPVHEVIAGESATAPLSFVLEACIAGSLSFTPAVLPPGFEKPFHVETSIFNSLPSRNLLNDKPFWRPQRKSLTASVIALMLAMDDVLSTDLDARNYTIWQCALLRTCSRPVDTIFSIMGLFGVDLDPAQFHKNDRHGATIALAQAVLRSGGSANWLGVGCRIERDRCLSTFPTFPHPSASGVAHIQTRNRTQEAADLLDPVYPIGAALVPLPRGDMDDAGYLTFSARALRLRLTRSASRGPRRTLKALDGSEWEVYDESNPVMTPDARHDHPGNSSSRLAYAALLGWFSRHSPGTSTAHDRENVRVMLLEEHAAGMFHLRSFFALHQSEKAYVLGWPEREFRVGGPNLPCEGPDAASGPGSAEGGDQTFTSPGWEQGWPQYPWTRPITSC